MKWNEKDAIRGHSVDRYQYAVQLVNENTEEGLVKAFAWLSLAAESLLDIFQALIIFFKALCGFLPSSNSSKFLKNSSARSRIFIINRRK